MLSRGALINLYNVMTRPRVTKQHWSHHFPPLVKLVLSVLALVYGKSVQLSGNGSSVSMDTVVVEIVQTSDDVARSQPLFDWVAL